MHPSLELRWFKEGVIPAAVARSVRAWPFKPETDERADMYLLGLDAMLGIKVRSGKSVEIKRLVEEYGARELTASTVGRVEQWVKWSFSLSARSKSERVSGQPGSWLTVHKRRRTRRFAVGANGRVKSVAATARVSRGVGYEITQLRVGRRRWWTAGFEAFGKSEELPIVMAAVLAHPDVLEEVPPFELADSLSYPAWLPLAAGVAAPRTGAR